MQEVQLSRQRNGAYGWSIARELADRELWTEWYHCPTWLDYLRQRNRPTQSERLLQDRALEFHLGPRGDAHSPDARETIWLCTLEGRDTRPCDD
jgi:hypothetical protein